MSLKYFGKGRRKQGHMNRLESSYAQHLELLKRSGEILNYWYESVKLRLADKTFYTPDFFVMKNDCSLEMHETKGFMMDDANVKLKVANELYPFKFVLVKKVKGQFVFETVGNKELPPR